jgi:hypothetical protein
MLLSKIIESFGYDIAHNKKMNKSMQDIQFKAI